MSEPTDSQKRVAIYARISTKAQNVEPQLLLLRKFALEKQWEVVREFVDCSSGTTADRREFRNLFSYAAQGYCDLVLFSALDRFSREGVSQTLEYMRRLKAFGVDYCSATEPFLQENGMVGEIALSVLSSIAHAEPRRVSDRTQYGLQEARAKGRIGGRPRKEVDVEKVLELRRKRFSLRRIAADLQVSAPHLCRVLNGKRVLRGKPEEVPDYQQQISAISKQQMGLFDDDQT